MREKKENKKNFFNLFDTHNESKNLQKIFSCCATGWKTIILNALKSFLGKYYSIQYEKTLVNLKTIRSLFDHLWINECMKCSRFKRLPKCNFLVNDNKCIRFHYYYYHKCVCVCLSKWETMPLEKLKIHKMLKY